MPTNREIVAEKCGLFAADLVANDRANLDVAGSAMAGAGLALMIESQGLKAVVAFLRERADNFEKQVQ